MTTKARAGYIAAMAMLGLMASLRQRHVLSRLLQPNYHEEVRSSVKLKNICDSSSLTPFLALRLFPMGFAIYRVPDTQLDDAVAAEFPRVHFELVDADDSEVELAATEKEFDAKREELEAAGADITAWSVDHDGSNLSVKVRTQDMVPTVKEQFPNDIVHVTVGAAEPAVG